MSNALRIAITPGEPAGIGPDLVVKIARQPFPVELVVVADPSLIKSRASKLGIALRVEILDTSRAAEAHTPGCIKVAPLPLRRPASCGHLDPANADYVLETLRVAARGCLNGTYSAMVTGPVHKGVLNRAGLPFTGHTEFLAELTHADTVVMMLMTPGLRVALVTTHLPLAQVSSAITRPHLEAVIRILHHDIEYRLGIKKPRILVCGLNPHAGEGGHLGHEDQEIVEPVLNLLRREGIDLTGPLPADTLFIPKYLNAADVVLAMYHDQGLPVLKHMGFGKAVNITLGLPILRTSVDHGTALELAGSGAADESSLIAAIEAAIDMAKRTH